MAVMFVIALCLLISSTLSIALLPVQASWHEGRGLQLRDRMERLGQAIQEHYNETPGGGLLGPEEIVLVSGYEHLRLERPEMFLTATGSNINDGVWRFDRRVFWIESPYNSVGDANYVAAANNACGAGTASSAISWCGRQGSLWVKVETREGNDQLILGEKQRLFRAMDKFVRGYVASGGFTSLSAGAVVTMPALVGYAGAASACAGVFNYNGIPFTCDNLFNQWGYPIVVNQVSAKHIALVNRTALLTASGQPVRLAEETKLE